VGSGVSGGGQTGRTSAHKMPWYDDFYYQVEDVHGFYVAQIAGESYKTAIDRVERTVEEEAIQCNFARVDGYLFPHAHTKEVHDKLLKVNTFTALTGGKSLPFFFQMACKEHEV
jgi:hypothetical protein